MTGLTALNPFFLSLLPLAALPVIFHLFFRLKMRARAFPTLMFFHRLDPRLNARRRLREWLILLLRTLLISLVVMCLAHPVWLGVGAEGSVAVVLVLDNSGSMSGTTESGQPKLKEALGAARTLVAQLRATDSAGLVLFVPDPATPLPPTLTSDKSALLNALEHIGETEASGGVAAAVERAVMMLEGSPAAHCEIHIFSDLQEEKWSQAPLNLRAPPRGSSVVVHRLASRAPSRNVTMATAQIQARSILPGRRIPIETRLINTGVSETAIRLNWLDDAGHRGSTELNVPARMEKTAGFMLEAQNPGVRWVNVWVEGDDFAADNHAPIVFTCSQKQPVLFFGSSLEFGQLPLATSPAREGTLSGLAPGFADTAEVVARLRDQPAGLVVATWNSFGVPSSDMGARWSALKRFLTAGGNALLVPAASPGPLGSQPDWLSIVPGALQQSPSGLAFSAVAKTHPLFNDVKDDKGEVALHNLKLFRFHSLRCAATNTPIFGLEDGRVVLAEESVGKGRLLVSGLAFDSAWSTLPLKPGFVVLAQNLALAQAAASTNILSSVAGEPLRLSFAQEPRIHVQALVGSPLDWKGPVAGLVTLPRSGIYTVRSGAEALYCAVRSSETEGRQRFLGGDALPALGKVAYSTRELAIGQGLVSEFRKLEKSVDLSWPLLLLAFAALGLEGWLANPVPMKGRLRTTKAATEPAKG